MEMRHPLAVWMDGHKEINQSKLAADSGCSEPHLSLILKGERGVSMRLAKRLSDATGGEVRIEDFLMAAADEARA
jgi:transcriptional regulator with XRE-family HTH domain